MIHIFLPGIVVIEDADNVLEKPPHDEYRKNYEANKEQTVLSFLVDNNIPRRDYIEAGRIMHLCPSKSIKFKKYPLLTYENVYNWYWEEKPPWSTTDIAEKIGCSQANVSKFMRENIIPRRNNKDAALNIFECPSKKKHYKLSNE